MVKRVKRELISEPLIRKGSDKISFGFGGLCNVSYGKAIKDGKFFIDFINRLKALCSLGWNGINTSWRHGYGFEMLDKTSMNKHIAALLPDGIAKLQVFRAKGDNHAFLGYRDGSIFQVVFIEYQFGDIYRH